MQGHNAVIIAVKHNVTAILRDGRAHPRVNDLLDDRNNFRIRPVRPCHILHVRAGGIFQQHRAFLDKMRHDDLQKRRFDKLPFAYALGDGDKITAEKYALNPVNREQRLGQWRGFGSRLIGKIRRWPVAGHSPTGQEFQRRRIGRILGLNKHGKLLFLLPI